MTVVTRQMPELVVDALEVVDVDHQQRDGSLVPLRAMELILETFVKVAPVEETADRVDDRRLRERLRSTFGAFAVQRERRGRRRAPGA